MPKLLISSLVLLFSISLFAQNHDESATQFVSKMDSKIPQLLKDHNVPGTALAIIDDGKIILQKGYGLADVENGVEVGIQTGFNIGSISKTVAAWGVMNLVREGKINLDDPVEKYLTRWHLPDSEFDSDGVTIRRCLSHTAGLSLHGYPGWSPSDELPTIEESLNGKNNGPGRVEIIHEPGSRYKYSGGGYTILQLIVEEVTGEKFEDYLHSNVIVPLGMTNSSYKIDDRILAGSSDEHDRFGEEIDFELFTAQAAAGFHTTIEDFARFALANMYEHKKFDNETSIIPRDELERMMRNTPQAKGRYGYGTAYGIHTLQEANWVLSGHRGANTGWMAIFKVNPVTNDGFVMFTNGGSGQDVYHAIYADWIYWKTGVAVEDWHYAKPAAASKLKEEIDANGSDHAAEFYQKLKINHPDKYKFEEGKMNQLGYSYLNLGQTDNAVAVLAINVEEYPNSSNAYDSYGEVLLEHGDREKAISSYKRSVQLNPTNDSAMEVLKDLGVDTDKLLYQVSEEELAAAEGQYQMVYNPFWEIAFEQNEGELRGQDGGYSYRVLPIEKGLFVNPDDGAQLAFETGKTYGDMLIFDGKIRFRKLDLSNTKPSIARKLVNVLDSTGSSDLAGLYNALKTAHRDEYDFSEEKLNSLGYYYKGNEKMDLALAAFALNIEAFPNSHNVYDSYGEALLESGDTTQAIVNYSTSVKMNAGNLYAFDVLKKLGVDTDSLITRVPQPELLALIGEYRMTEDADWTLVITEENGEMTGYDGAHEIELIPIGNNTLVVPDGTVRFEFDVEDSKAVGFELIGEYRFERVD